MSKESHEKSFVSYRSRIASWGTKVDYLSSCQPKFFHCHLPVFIPRFVGSDILPSLSMIVCECSSIEITTCASSPKALDVEASTLDLCSSAIAFATGLLHCSIASSWNLRVASTVVLAPACTASPMSRTMFLMVSENAPSHISFLLIKCFYRSFHNSI